MNCASLLTAGWPTLSVNGALSERKIVNSTTNNFGIICKHDSNSCKCFRFNDNNRPFIEAFETLIEINR